MTAATPAKLCIDCKWHRYAPPNSHKCVNPKVNSKNGSWLVEKATDEAQHCSLQRSWRRGLFSNICGAKGKFWEPSK